MKFLRHLAAATLAVAVVVAAGLAWGHFANHLPPGAFKTVNLSGPKVAIAQPSGTHPGRRVTPGIHLGPSGPMDLGLTSMFQAVNLPVLRDTVEIEAGAIAAVVLLEIAHRKLRRARHSRFCPASPPPASPRPNALPPATPLRRRPPLPLPPGCAGQVAIFSFASLRAWVTPAAPLSGHQADNWEYFGMREHKGFHSPQNTPGRPNPPA